MDPNLAIQIQFHLIRRLNTVTEIIDKQRQNMKNAEKRQCEIDEETYKADVTNPQTRDEL